MAQQKQESYTRFEKARIIGARALQISSGAPMLITFSDGELAAMRYNPVEIAKREFDADLIPLTVRRPFPLTMFHKNQEKKDKQAS
mgnify:CR=1 FL=1